MKYEITIVSENDNGDCKYLMYLETEDSEYMVTILSQLFEVQDEYFRECKSK